MKPTGAPPEVASPIKTYRLSLVGHVALESRYPLHLMLETTPAKLTAGRAALLSSIDAKIHPHGSIPLVVRGIEPPSPARMSRQDTSHDLITTGFWRSENCRKISLQTPEPFQKAFRNVSNPYRTTSGKDIARLLLG